MTIINDDARVINKLEASLTGAGKITAVVSTTFRYGNLVFGKLS
jgi:hypothetical protein